jgi:hypothetical protein
MLILQWKELAGSAVPARYQDVSGHYPWPASVMAAVIPIATPHSLGNIRTDLLQLVEDLRMYVFSAARKGKKIFLPEDSVAIIARHGSIIATYHSKEKTDMGSWLQRFAPWEGDNQLHLADDKHFLLQFVTASNQDATFALHAKMELGWDTKDCRPMLHNWLRSRPFVHLWDIYELGEGLVRASDLLLYPPQELLKSKTRQEQTEKRAITKLCREWADCGITLHQCEMRWEIRPLGEHTITQKVKALHDRDVESMERERLEQALWEARYANGPNKQSSGAVSSDWEEQLSQSQQASQHNLQAETGAQKAKHGSSPDGLSPMTLENRQASHTHLQKEMIQKETHNSRQQAENVGQQMPDLPPLGPSVMEIAKEAKACEAKPSVPPKQKSTLEEQKIIEHKRHHQRQEMALEETHE